MLAGTLPRQPERQHVAILQSPPGTCEGCREHPPCLRILPTPCSRAPRESRSLLRTTDSLEGGGGGSWLVLVGAHKEPGGVPTESCDTPWRGATEAQRGCVDCPCSHTASILWHWDRSQAAGPEFPVSPASSAPSGAGVGGSSLSLFLRKITMVIPPSPGPRRSKENTGGVGSQPRPCGHWGCYVFVGAVLGTAGGSPYLRALTKCQSYPWMVTTKSVCGHC